GALRASGRAEERGSNLFARVKEFAFTRAAPERPLERQAPRFTDGRQQPRAEGQAALAGGLDEIGDIPSFLRRERVES
ncbi:MAG: hypothetical protein ACJ8H8_09280, partial [Geminicoccaceae bacterium]